MAKKSDIEIIAEKIADELDRTAEAIVPVLFGDLPPDTKRLTLAEFLEDVRMKWPDPTYRRSLAHRLGALTPETQADGAKRLLALYKEAFPAGYNPAVTQVRAPEVMPTGAALLARQGGV